MTTLRFEPLISLVWWISLAAAGGAMLLWYGRGRPSVLRRRQWATILALMAAGLALVLFILLNPTWIEPVAPPAGKPALTLLLDASASMATPDVPGRQTRFQAAARLARGLAGEAGDRFEVRTLTFGAGVKPVDAADLATHVPKDQITDLAAAVRGGLEDRYRWQSVVLLSDGIHNAGGGAARVLAAARTARALACPVYTRTFGGNTAVKDLQVELQAPQELAFVGEKISVIVLLRQRGLAGRKATLKLLHEGKEVDRREVALTRQPATEVRFQVQKDQTGLFHYEVRADPLPGEISLANNSATLLLRVVDQPVRVLLLEGKPYWDSKFLVRTLLAGPSIELDSAVRMTSQRVYARSWKRKGTTAAATLLEERKVLTGRAPFQAFFGPERLRGYQVVVLGRDAETFLSDEVLGRLRSWLRDGGCLVCYRGQPMAQVNQLLGQILPLRWTPTRESRFRMSLTEQGRNLHWFFGSDLSLGEDPFDNLPTLATTARPEQPKPLAIVLATAGSAAPESASPVVAYQPYGTGRVVVIEGSGMWRWAFLPPAQKKLDQIYQSLWHSLMRWLISGNPLLPGQKLALRTDKVSFSVLEPATATLIVREEQAQEKVPVVELVPAGGGKLHKITPVPLGDEPGVFRVVFGKLPEGRYQARVAGKSKRGVPAETAFDVRSLFEEQLDLQARPDLMARIAQESDGGVLEGDSAAEILEGIQTDLERLHPLQVRRVCAWDRWWVLLGVIAVWGSAWALCRRQGLI